VDHIGLPIQVVSRLTGLSPHVIRLWEKRYAAVSPERTKRNRRHYSKEAVNRLQLLARATASGHEISLIARLGLDELRRLVNTETSAQSRVAPAGSDNLPGRDVVELESIDAALKATTSFDAAALLQVMEVAAVRFGWNGMLRRLLGPLAQSLGERWLRGELTAAHEHFATAVIRDFLARTSRPYAIDSSAPPAIVATPAGQLHELGAVMVSAAAANLGWRSIYLGASLPCTEIAGPALQQSAKAVLLSIVYPEDDPKLGDELRRLRHHLPASIEIIVGGRAAKAYDEVLREIGALRPVDWDELNDLLENLRETDLRSKDRIPYQRISPIGCLPARESELISLINRGPPEQLWTICQQLTAKSKEEGLSETEEAEFSSVVEQLENYAVERIVWLSELATLRSLSLEALMAQLELQPRPHA
jgi:DNA-binding transcriptional MerR regulator/methylmalonyl-CoA mutase cobalamin-binding subunit